MSPLDPRRGLALALDVDLPAEVHLMARRGERHRDAECDYVTDAGLIEVDGEHARLVDVDPVLTATEALALAEALTAFAVSRLT